MKEDKLGKLTEEELEAGIRIYGERIAEIERTLERNIEYPSEREKYELRLNRLKNKRGVFLNLYKKYLEYQLKKSDNKPLRKLSNHSRKVLEEKLEKCKKRVADFYKIKSFRNY